MGLISSIKFFFVKETYFQKFQGLIKSLTWETKSLYKMPENRPVKSDYNSKWAIGALAEAKGV